MMGNVFDTRVSENFAVNIEGGTFALAGFFLDLAGELIVHADIADLKRNGEFVKKADDCSSPGTAALYDKG